jgi:hypothetical protein
MCIEANETLIVGSWVMMNGEMIADSVEQRIDELIQDRLQRVSSTSGGWEVLFKDPRDGRYWELFFPRSEMHGGGPKSLRVIDLEIAKEKYGGRIGSENFG